MKVMTRVAGRIGAGLAVVALLVAAVPAQSVSADSTVLRAQQIAQAFELPVGAADGKAGPNTSRGLCAWRLIAGRTPERRGASPRLVALMDAHLNQYKRLQNVPAPNLGKNSTYMLVDQTCQVMVYVKDNRYQKVFPVSTGKNERPTPNGTFHLGPTVRGWTCSTIAPESCDHHTAGRFAHLPGRGYGNMYNKREISGAIKLHGSVSVPTYPGSLGCVRVTVTDADWIYATIPTGIHIKIAGKY